MDQKAHDRIQIPHEKTFTGTAKNPDHVAYLVSIKPSKKKSLWNREHWLATDFFFFLEMSKFIKKIEMIKLEIVAALGHKSVTTLVLIRQTIWIQWQFPIQKC